MATRFERGLAEELNLWTIICRMASTWKVEDDEAGRRSYTRPDRVIEKNPSITGIRGRV